MIHIINDYYVTGQARDYALIKDMHKKDKNGDTVYKTLGYYSNIANAVEATRKIQCREITAKENMELCEAVKAFGQIAEKLAKVTEGLK